VWWVELAPISDPALVPQAAQALMIREEPGRSMTETLARDLASTRLLLVMDNCEHLISSCARLANVVLSACPGVHILATSREALAVEGEMAWPVRPLSAPESGNLGAGELEHYESVRLFVERARYRRPGFALDGSNAAPVAEICRSLDGIPLAIELAAARIGTLSASQISSRLERSLKLLTSAGPSGPGEAEDSTRARARMPRWRAIVRNSKVKSRQHPTRRRSRVRSSVSGSSNCTMRVSIASAGTTGWRIAYRCARSVQRFHRGFIARCSNASSEDG